MSLSTIRIFVSSFLLFTTLSATACEVCGCANAGSYFGIMPQVGRSFVGLRYRTASFDSHLSNPMLQTREQFQSTEPWGRFYPFKRVQVLASIPYFFNHQVEVKTGVNRRRNALGDASLMANYTIFNTFWDSTYHGTTQHSLLIGGGVKLRTGRYEYDIAGLTDVANPNFQPGTGSTDWMLSALYSMRIGEWGWNSDVTYRYNGINASRYRFGNRITANTLLFYSKELEKLTLMPSLGLYTEVAEKDYNRKEKLERTGGHITTANAGVDVFLKRFSIGALYQHPIAQHLAIGEIRASARFTTHLTFMF